MAEPTGAPLAGPPLAQTPPQKTTSKVARISYLILTVVGVIFFELSAYFVESALSNEASQRYFGWLITFAALIFMGWFLYAFTSVFAGKDWEERTKGKGVVWERRTMMVCVCYLFTILLLLLPFGSEQILSARTTRDGKPLPISIDIGCAEPSYKYPQLSPGEVRERLAFQIMQFVSAPLVAITAYYAIGPDTKLASVALAFTSGFASEPILLMIRGVVDGIKPQALSTQPTKGTASGVVVAQATNQPFPNVALSVIGQPSLTTKSDPRGLFVIHGIPVGDQVIDATLNNQNTKTKVTIDAGKTSVCQIALA